jgi:hypothetical protein
MRGKTNLALQFPSCPLDAASALRDGAYSMDTIYEEKQDPVRRAE